MQHHLITLTCLLAAVVSFLTSYGVGIGIFFGIGLLFEIVFWARFTRARREVNYS